MYISKFYIRLLRRSGYEGRANSKFLCYTLKMKFTLIIFAVVAVVVGLGLSLIVPHALENKKILVSANQTIADVLKKDFNQSGFLVWLADIFKTNENLKPGWYSLGEDKLSLLSLWNFFSQKQNPQEVSVRLLEGKKSAEFFNILETAGVAKVSDLKILWQKPPADFYTKYEVLKAWPKKLSLEGLLFPETYRFFVNDKAENVLARLLEQSNKNWLSLGAKNVTAHEAFTLASIVEAEAATDEDRALVAGIFWDRLKYGLALQADSTVNYVTGKSEPGASTADTKIDSPYNTYKYKGLPPGPINNPSLSALKAVVHPAASPYLYFFSTKDGTIIYSRTFAEHLENRVKFGI